MPNWCYQKLSVSGLAEDIAAFKKACLNEKLELELNRVVPMPPELDIEEGSSGEHGYDALFGDWQKRFQYPAWLAVIPKEAKESREAYIAWLREYNPEALDLGRLYQDNLHRHGHRSWWQWRIAHWGTKWEIGADSQELTSCEDAFIGIQLWTAWSPILPALEVMTENHPALTFGLWYLDEGGGFAGYATAESGLVFDSVTDWKETATCQFDWEFEDEEAEA